MDVACDILRVQPFLEVPSKLFQAVKDPRAVDACLLSHVGVISLVHYDSGAVSDLI